MHTNEPGRSKEKANDLEKKAHTTEIGRNRKGPVKTSKKSRPTKISTDPAELQGKGLITNLGYPMGRPMVHQQSEGV